MNQEGAMVICPYCKEAIKQDAIKCRHCGSMLQNEMPSSVKPPGDSLTFVKNAFKGKFEIIKLIGKGGMASVYKARQLNLNRIIALKVIHPNLIYDQEFVDRFLLEARVCASLSHPNIISIYDFGEAQGIYYIAMELLEGNDIAALIQKKKKLRPQTATDYLAPIAHALLYMHNRGYMHRDVKSSNIFITNDGRSVLMDFGIAFASGGKALTVVGTLLGTPQFLSPEQAMGNKATPESDYYSLGIVLYECITGKVPFNDPNPLVVLTRITKEIPASPNAIYKDIPQNISELTMLLLSKNPRNRTSAIKQLLQAFYERKNYKSSSLPFFYKTNHNGSSIVKKIYPKNLYHLTTGQIKSGLLILVFLFLFMLLGGIVFSIVKTLSATDQLLATQQSVVLNENGSHSIKNEEVTLKEETKKTTLPPPILLIEEQMIDFQGNKIMQTYVTNKIWRMIILGQNNGDDHPIRQVSYSDVEIFLNKINNLPNNSFRYELPSISLITEGIISNRISGVRSEWVADPPVFAGVERSGFAKYFINDHQFNYEGGIERNKKQPNIYLRLVRTTNE